MNKDELLEICRLHNLTELETNILIDFYSEGKSLKYLAGKYKYSEINISKLKAEALKKIKK